ncbi:Dabb family protein [Nonomuraea sp. NPDC048901]|uniref:Dabb family protein n=1 Tax=Nonomuraea sp. NPDC048901 TaxID=3155627 RepID=UPI0034007F6B
MRTGETGPQPRHELPRPDEKCRAGGHRVEHETHVVPRDAHVETRNGRAADQIRRHEVGRDAGRRHGEKTEQIEQALESMRNQGRVISAVKSFVVGRDYGGDFDWGGVFVIEDIDGYWEYLTHPAHARTDQLGMPLVEKYDSYDITDDDPQMGAKIADLHRQRYEGDPELAALVGMLP